MNGCDAGSEFFNLTSVEMNVLASNVKHIALKSVLRAMENNAGFITVLNSTIFFAPRNTPSSKGMLNRSSRGVPSTSVREISCMP